MHVTVLAALHCPVAHQCTVHCTPALGLAVQELPTMHSAAPGPECTVQTSTLVAVQLQHTCTAPVQYTGPP